MKTSKYAKASPSKLSKAHSELRIIRRRSDLLEWLLSYAAQGPKRQYPGIIIDLVDSLRYRLCNGGTETDKDRFLDGYETPGRSLTGGILVQLADDPGKLQWEECSDALVEFAGAAMARLDVHEKINVDDGITLAFLVLRSFGLNFQRVSRGGQLWLEGRKNLEREHGIKVCVRIPRGY